MFYSPALPCLALQSSGRGEAPPPIENLGIAIVQTSEQLIAITGAEPSRTRSAPT